VVEPAQLPSTDPDPDGSKARVAALFSSVAREYDTAIEFFAPFGRALVAAAELQPGQRVLDLASGRGAVLRPVLEAVGPTGSVLGLDLAPAMVAELGAELEAAAVGNAQVQVGDAEELDLPDASFDAVTGGFMIFFPPRPDRVLRQAARVLRPGGAIALSIFDCMPGFPFQQALIEEMGVQREEPGPQMAFNRAEVLDAALRDAGFVGVEGVVAHERFVFDSPEHVLRWQRSTGARTLIDALEQDSALHRYQERLAVHLEDHRAPEGGYELVQQARMTVAHKPR
jgi:ubiquinone/menaquinone biosynthesis C-methylase UbiE